MPTLHGVQQGFATAPRMSVVAQEDFRFEVPPMKPVSGLSLPFQLI